VLVLGEDTRSFLTTIRSLGRQGIEVEVVPSNFAAPALRSRYIRGVHRLPAYAGDGAEWIAAARRLIAERRFQVVMPCDDRSILPFHAHRAQFADLTILAIPDPRAIDVLFDKEKTKALAAEVGVNLARTEALEGADPAGVLARLGSPVVVKPKNSYRIEHLHRRAAVRMADTADALAGTLAEMGATDCYAEEFFQGTGVGVSVLAHRGTILAAFQHHRVHEPSRGAGASSYRVSAPLSPELEQACARMLGALEYTGVAMFEFRRNFTTGAWILLEVNARPWGSMPLPVSLGVDFPYRWYRLLVDGDASKHPGYQAGIHGRNLILDIQFAVGAIAEARGVRARLAVAADWLRSFRHLLAGRERNDTITPDDRAPGLTELRQFTFDLLARIGRRLPLALPVERLVARRKLRAALRAAARRSGPPVLVFVCYGNICRSPFAERLLDKKLRRRRGVVTVGSAGTYAVGGRRSPDTGIGVAQRFAIELESHRSQYLTDDMARAADAILVFDQSNVETVHARFPELDRRVIRVGLLAEDRGIPGQIADPYGGDERTYQHNYRQIERAVDGLHRLILREVR